MMFLGIDWFILQNGDRSKLLEKKNQLLQKRPFVAPSKSRSRKWQPKPKLQWKMSGEIAVDSMKEGKS